MKNKLLICTLLVGVGLSITGCDFIPQFFSSFNWTSTDQKPSNTTHPERSSVSVAPDTPKEWLDLFNFTNVTIKVTNYVIGTNITYYKYVNSVPYVKNDGSEDFVPYYDEDVTDIFKANYRVFTFSDEDSGYHAKEWNREGGQFVDDVDIYVSEGKIRSITHRTYADTVGFVSEYEFYDYGTTRLKDEPITPDFWINMFTFDNVTIKMTRNNSGREASYYMFVDGKQYYKQNVNASSVEAQGELFGDVYKNNYSIFNLKEDETACHCVNWKKHADNDWLYDVDIYVMDGKVKQIVEKSHIGESLSVIETYDFYDYGVTNLDN